MNIYDLSEAAIKLHGNVRWLADGLRAGRFPGKKIGRKWVLSDEDIVTILEICTVNHTSEFSAGSCGAASSSMTPTTARRLQQRLDRGVDGDCGK
ncbi:DNA-binding protein [Mycobacterium colombiense]|uniref:DNA-binding protein n=1 Tax=Mycobacterium colombiense TaxID=339268 RepID=UPI0012DB6C81|nr:DNA-binding protein [Mycobacterium colombiense]